MIFKPSQQEKAIDYLVECFNKKKHVKIEHIPDAKSLSQNRYIWLAFTIVADDTGNSKEDIYQYYLEKFPVIKELEIKGEVKRIKQTLSQFTKDETRIFIDRVVIDARQEGFIIPDPEDLKALEAYNYYKKKGY